MALRNAWSDRALVGAPILIHVVAPQPPASDGAEAIHVLLVQNSQDGVSTTLITGYDDGQSQEVLHLSNSPSPPMSNSYWTTSFLVLD